MPEVPNETPEGKRQRLLKQMTEKNMRRNARDKAAVAKANADLLQEKTEREERARLVAQPVPGTPTPGQADAGRLPVEALGNGEAQGGLPTSGQAESVRRKNAVVEKT